MQAYIDKRNEEEDKLKKIHEEEVAKDPKKKDKKTINWKEFLKSKNKPVEEKKVEEVKKVEAPKPLKKIINQGGAEAAPFFYGNRYKLP